MPKSFPRDARTKPGLMRNRIAEHAARLIADGGIDDFALAKRKAARQLGAPSTRSLPDDDEIEIALRAYRALFNPDEHQAVIQELRLKALCALRFFERFEPYLSGAVLKGTAGRHSAINVQLFAANEKELAVFLLNNSVSFESAIHHLGGNACDTNASVLRLEWMGCPLYLALHERADRRSPQKHARPGAGPERAGLAALERLVEAGATPDGP